MKSDKAAKLSGTQRKTKLKALWVPVTKLQGSLCTLAGQVPGQRSISWGKHSAHFPWQGADSRELFSVHGNMETKGSV